MSVTVHAITPVNELLIARELERRILAAWPDLETHASDHIDIFVGVRLVVEVDLLVLVDFAHPREIDFGGGHRTRLSCGLFAIEVKQLDAERFEILGGQLIPRYHHASETVKPVTTQAIDEARNVRLVASQRGAPGSYVHALAWLPNVDEEFLSDNEIESMVLGRDAQWLDMLDAANRQRRFDQAFVAPNQRAVRTLRDLLLKRRVVSRRDLARVNLVSQDLARRTVVNELAQRAGHAQLRLQGRGGSGKTISLILLALTLAERNERVLLLTFHHALRNDIEVLVEAFRATSGVPEDVIRVDSVVEYLTTVLLALGISTPSPRSEQFAFSAYEQALRTVCARLKEGDEVLRAQVDELLREQPEEFGWDHVMIDEAQDWVDAERDLIRAFYGHQRLVLADGVDQLVRRQTICDWRSGVPRDEQYLLSLGSSLRMLGNIASFANATAGVMGLHTWSIEPKAELSGGHIFIITGEIDVPALLGAMIASAAANNADPNSCLICIPPTGVEREPQRRAIIARLAEEAGIATWDGTIRSVREESANVESALRIVQYDSCRGLEGWITLAMGLDELFEQRLRYPNLEDCDDGIDPVNVAKRWLMIPLTRAVHTLIITLRDPNSDVAGYLRSATSMMPEGVVRWGTSAQCVAYLTPSTAPRIARTVSD